MENKPNNKYKELFLRFKDLRKEYKSLVIKGDGKTIYAKGIYLELTSIDKQLKTIDASTARRTEQSTKYWTGSI